MNAPVDLNNLPSDSRDVAFFNYTAKHLQHPNISVGEYTYGLPTIMLNYPQGKINIGKFCSISSRATFILNFEHRMDWISTYPFPVLTSDWPAAADRYDGANTFRGDVKVGNDVWIGAGSVIMGGADIGDGAVIGAYAVVTKKVAPYSVVVGNPLREVRKRFSGDDIAKLLKIKWWDWPIEKIQKYAGLLSSGDVDALYTVKDK